MINASATHQLMISGEGGDTVTIKDVGNWNKTSTTTIVNGETYEHLHINKHKRCSTLG